jgi:hypothetical protein
VSNTYRNIQRLIGIPQKRGRIELDVHDDGDSWVITDSEFEMTVAGLSKLCEDNGIDPKDAVVSGAYGEPTEMRWPKEHE